MCTCELVSDENTYFHAGQTLTVDTKVSVNTLFPSACVQPNVIALSRRLAAATVAKVSIGTFYEDIHWPNKTRCCNCKYVRKSFCPELCPNL